MSSPPFTVRAVFEYASGHDDDLSFAIGQVITVTDVEDTEWYSGEYTDGSGAKQEGIFPKNFVERYEPPAPPRPARPNRPKKEPEPAPVEPPAVTESQLPAEPDVAEQLPAHEPEPISQQPPAVAPQSPPLVSSPPAVEEPSSPLQPVQSIPQPVAPAADPAPPVVKASKPPPPAVAEKPSGNSFKDRIAAFNRPAATPLAPLAPGGQKPSSFVKKQFVAPPPSKDSYVAPPREPAPKIYKREEDPEVQEQVAREPPVSESRPPPPPPQPLSQETEEGAEDQPKPTSLKDRIALLQKQQMEQAQRHAEAAQKKEKPKPPKKPVEQPIEQAEPIDEPEASPVEPTTTSTARDPSVDTLRAKPPHPHPPMFSPPEEIAASDTNDADSSAPADSDDAGETSTSKDDEDERPRQMSTHTIEQKGEEVDVKEQAEEEEEMDPETRRRMELRERMAKMSGGMGMMGLFGPPGGMPGMSAPGARKPKTPGESENKLGDPEPTSPGHAPPVPMVPMPGMNLNTKPAPPADVEKEDEEPLATPVSEQHPPREVPDVEEVVHGVLPRRSTDRAPPVPPATGKIQP